MTFRQVLLERNMIVLQKPDESLEPLHFGPELEAIVEEQTPRNSVDLSRRGSDKESGVRKSGVGRVRELREKQPVLKPDLAESAPIDQVIPSSFECEFNFILFESHWITFSFVIHFILFYLWNILLSLLLFSLNFSSIHGSSNGSCSNYCAENSKTTSAYVWIIDFDFSWFCGTAAPLKMLI